MKFKFLLTEKTETMNVCAKSIEKRMKSVVLDEFVWAAKCSNRARTTNVLTCDCFSSKDKRFAEDNGR